MSHLISNLALLMAAVSAAYLLFKAIQSICSKKTRVEPHQKNRGLVDHSGCDYIRSYERFMD